MEPSLEYKSFSKQEFTPLEFLNRYKKYLPWLALAIILSGLAGYLYLRYTVKEYTVSGKLSIKNEESFNTNEEKFASVFLMGNGVNLNNEIVIMKSSSILQRVVQALQLETEYIGLGNVKAFQFYNNSPVRLDVLQKTDSSIVRFSIQYIDSSSYRLNGEETPRKFGVPFKSGSGVYVVNRTQYTYPVSEIEEFEIYHYPLDLAVEKLVKFLTIAQVNDLTNILEISYQSANRKMAADVVNTLMQEYGKSTVEDKNTIAVNTIRFIDERLDSLQSELSGVEGKLQRYQESNDAVALESQATLYIGELGEMEKRANESAVKQKVIDWLMKYISQPSNTNSTVPVNLGVDEPTLAPLIAAFNEIQVKRSTLLKTTTEKNPAYIDLTIAADKIRADIIEALKSVEASYVIAEKELQKRMNTARLKTISIPGKNRQLLDISRQQKIKEELFLLLLSKREEVAIGSAAVLPNSAIIERANERGKLMKPVPKTVFLQFILGGIALSVMVFFLLEIFNNKVTTYTDVEKNTSAPIAGEVGRSTDPNPLLFTRQNRSFLTEQFRAIRTNLTYLTNNAPKPVLLVTSSMSGEGKSFISTNIAAAYALTGKRTLILEFDIRKPKVAQNLGVTSKKGITSYLVTNEDPANMVFGVEDIENLFIFPCGVIPPNPSEMLLLKKMDQLFEWARANFDVVVIDSAPLGVVSDALTLAKFSDATLYIIRQQYTLKKMVELIDKQYQQKRLPNMAIVINDVKSEGGYGYGYGYGYARKSGYFEKDVKVKK